MNFCFYETPLLNLPQQFVLEICNLNIKSLTNEDGDFYDVDGNKTKDIVTNAGQPLDGYHRVYGSNFEKLGKIEFWNLPKDLEQKIYDFYQDFWHCVGDRPKIRLQAVTAKSDGPAIPVHFDADKTISIMHPLVNHKKNIFTTFYTHEIEFPIWQQHYNAVKDPQWPACDDPALFHSLPMEIQKELYADNFSYDILASKNLRHSLQLTLVDPSKVVELAKIEIIDNACVLNVDKCHSVVSPFTETRLSLYWKFNNAEFQNLISAYEQYVQIKQM